MNKKMIIIFLLIVATIVSFIYLSHVRNKAALEPLQYVEELDISQLEFSISKGIDFIYQNQLPYGEFKTYVALDKKLNKCFFVSSPFLTTFVLYSISFMDNLKVEEMTKRALDFLLKEKEPLGIWRFFSSRSKMAIRKADLDDISCVSFALEKENIPFDSNKRIVLENRNEQGLFYTWIMGIPDTNIDRKDVIDYDIKTNSIDCGINANVLFYLGENKDTKKVCQYLNDIILNNEEDSCSIYYPEKLAFYYIFSRTYFNGASCLEQSKASIINRTTSIQNNDGSFGNVLYTAFATCVLLNFNYHGTAIDKAIIYILNNQRMDGSWPRDAFFYTPKDYITPDKYTPTEGYFGSEELTTALCLEALARYRQLMNADE